MSYVFSKQTNRYHKAETGETVEWFDFEREAGWRFWIDIRLDGPRFAVVQMREALRVDGKTQKKPELVAYGFIDPDPGRGAVPLAVFDAPPLIALPPLLSTDIADKWLEMRDRIRAMP